MKVVVNIKGGKEKISSLLDRIPHEDLVWLTIKKMNTEEQYLQMDLAGVVRLLTNLDKIEKIDFEVR